MNSINFDGFSGYVAKICQKTEKGQKIVPNNVPKNTKNPKEMPNNQSYNPKKL